MNWLMSEVLKPISRRLGTAAGAYMIAQGVDASTAETIVAGGIALVGLLVDLGFSHYERKTRK